MANQFHHQIEIAIYFTFVISILLMVGISGWTRDVSRNLVSQVTPMMPEISGAVACSTLALTENFMPTRG